MHFAFTEDQELFRKSLRDVLDKNCTPDHVRQAWNNDDGRIPGLWAQLAELGIVGLTVPEEHGGLGMNELDLVLLLEEAGRAALPEPFLETTAVAAPLIAELGANALQAEWLPKIATGDAIVTVGLEPDRHVCDAHIADLLLLQRGDALHALPRSQVEAKAQQSVDRSRKLFSLQWEPAADTRVANGQPARAALQRAQNRSALGAAAQLLGLSQALLDVTVEYTKVRQQFGKPIGTFQAVKHRLADTLLKLDFARPLVYRAAYSMAHGDPDAGIHVSMAKIYAGRAANFATRSALQLHGAIGYTYEYDLHQWMKRAWALTRAAGDEQTHLRRVSGHVLGN